MPNIIPPLGRMRQAAAAGLVLLTLLVAACARPASMQSPADGSAVSPDASGGIPAPEMATGAPAALAPTMISPLSAASATHRPTPAPTHTVLPPSPSATTLPSPTPPPSPTTVPTDTPLPATDVGLLPPLPPASGPVPPTGVPEAGAYRLPNVAHIYQKWNNCGPSSILMALSAFGIELDQLAVAAQLKPDREDTNVTPDELAGFARSQGLAAIVRYNGNRDILRALIQAGVPVVVEHWIEVHGRGEMGHFRVVTGYDNSTGQFITNDSYFGANRHYDYDTFEHEWRPFLGAYVVAYRPEQEGAVRAAIGADWDDAAMGQRALVDQTRRTAEAPDDAWAWFSLGEVHARIGDYAAAVQAFDRANAIGLPFRAYWYQFGYYRALYESGAYDRLIAHADATIASMKGENLEESHYWRGLALRQLGREDEARASFERALAFNPLYAPARTALGQ